MYDFQLHSKTVEISLRQVIIISVVLRDTQFRNLSSLVVHYTWDLTFRLPDARTRSLLKYEH